MAPSDYSRNAAKIESQAWKAKMIKQHRDRADRIARTCILPVWRPAPRQTGRKKKEIISGR